MRNALNRDIINTILKERKRLLALATITALGVMMMCGLKAACDDLRVSADQFFDEQHLHDISIQSTLGLDEDDLEAIRELDFVETVQGDYREEVGMLFGGMNHSVAVYTFTKDGIDCPYVEEGTLPQKADEIAVSSTFLKAAGLSIGDHVTISERLDEPEEEAEEDQNSEDEDEIEIDTSGLEEEAEKPNFLVTEYVITASVTDIRNITNPEGATSFRSTGNDEYAMFVCPEAVDSEIYTSLSLTIRGAAEVSAYSDEYNCLVDDAMREIEATVKARREQERYASVYTEAEEKIADARETIEDAFADAEEELADARKELDDGWAELADGEQELLDGEAELNSEEKKANDEIASARAKIADGRAQITSGEAQIEEAVKKLDASSAEFTENEAKLQAGKAELTAGYEQLNAGYAEMDAKKQELDAAYAQLSGDDPVTLATKAQLEAGLAELEAGRTTLDEQKAVLDASLAELTANEAALAEGKAQIEAGYAEIEAQKATLAQSKAELDRGEAELNEKEADARREIEKARQEIEDGRAELLDGRKELEDGEAEYADGVKTFEEKKEEALQKLADAEAELSDIPKAEWYVQNRMDLSSFANTVSDTDCIEAIGIVFPVMFLVIAILISLTTITRMVEEDRGLIGTYQALGFFDREIRRKYMIYAATACILGGIVGNIGGFFILPKILFIIFDTMYIVPSYRYVYSAVYGMGGILLFTGSIVAATFLSCENTLKEKPAALMRPRPPKKGSRILLERISFLWKKMNFLNKVTARNLFRYKKRFLMTVIGIAGCTGLLICGFSIKDTVADLMPKQYGNIVRYDLLVANNGGDDNEDMLELLKQYPVKRQINLEISSMRILNENGESVTAQAYVAENVEELSTYLGIMDMDNGEVTMEDGEVYVTNNAARILGFGEGDAVYLQDLKLNRQSTPVTGIIRNYLGNSIFMTRNTYEALFGEFEENAALVILEEDADEAAIAKEIGGEEFIVSVTSTKELKSTFSQSFKLMNLVVYVVVVLAAGLAFVVLFTLSATNISERERELATIKVLGFYDHEVHTYVNKESLILTLIGIAAGIPVGIGAGYSLEYVLKLPSVEFALSIHKMTFVISAVISLLFALAVNLLTNKTLNRIDPVEALKSVE